MNSKKIAILTLLLLTLACGTSSNTSSNNTNPNTTSNNNNVNPVNTLASTDGFSEQLAESGRGGGEQCEGAPASRLYVGAEAYVCTQSDRLIVREGPFRGSDEVTRIPPGTQMTIIDGKECANNWTWWYIETDSGITGWVSEGGDSTDPYFICPLP